MNQTEKNIRRISAAADGDYGTDQERIAKVGAEWISLLLKKNADYGSSVWKRPVMAPGMSPDAAIRARMSDKIERIIGIMAREPEITEETLANTIMDLGAYCLLWLARPDEQCYVDDEPEKKPPGEVWMALDRSKGLAYPYETKEEAEVRAGNGGEVVRYILEPNSNGGAS